MKKTFAIIFALFMVAVFVSTGFAENRTTEKVTKSSIAPGQVTIIKKLTPKESYELIKENKNNPDFVILDIRTPEEFESGHIEGAMNINYHSDKFTEDLGKLDKNKTYLVYCRTGRRSGDTVGIMTKLGFRELYRINGDIVQWKSEGLPVIKGKK